MECPICYESFTLIYMIVPPCKHAYCRELNDETLSSV